MSMEMDGGAGATISVGETMERKVSLGPAVSARTKTRQPKHLMVVNGWVTTCRLQITPFIADLLSAGVRTSRVDALYTI